MEFGELTINDSAIIIPLAHKLRPAADSSQLSGYLAEMFDLPTFHCFGLWQEGKLIALSFGWITVRFYSGKQLEVDNVIVDPDILDVIASVNFFERVASAAGKEWPTEVRSVVVPHYRDDVRTPRLQLFGK